MGIWGQDWSSYQSATPDTSGLSFAFTKVTEGLSYVNPRWVSQRDHAKASGLVWGAYHYPHVGNSVQAEADYFLGQVAWKPGDMVVLDWEGYDAANQGVSRGTQAAYKKAWLRYVKGKLPHNPVGMYANLDYWRNIDTTSYAGDFLWIATAGLPVASPVSRPHGCSTSTRTVRSTRTTATSPALRRSGIGRSHSPRRLICRSLLLTPRPSGVTPTVTSPTCTRPSRTPQPSPLSQQQA
ncbi:hydrolase [Streptomyces noursei ATCC 11455]|uniref:glycoside hydrolase family 25 protein n=1 Tax=Streptomyces noursei TaxID=1971 RepID=UPI00081D2290|nr:hydrolase [Streptomyces noursei ATCC 11455]